MEYINGLNEQQKEAVLTPYKHVRVIAGAGSGKTRVLTTRIVHLVKTVGISPRKICAITFTNKAANEMKARLQDMLKDESGVNTSTIHALCVRIIREEFEALGLVRNFTILDSTDQQSILKEAYRQFGYERKALKYGRVLGYISNNKVAGISPDQAHAMSYGSYEDGCMAKVYEFYQTQLKEMFALDFDDLLLQVNHLFKTNETVKQRWQRRFNVILVDEFQDVDHIQYSIIDSLVGDENELYVVGDPDQTIYTWRGANMDFIVGFNKHYPDSITITLNQNYRSTQKILDCANQLINWNTNRVKKDLIANFESDEPVIYGHQDDEEMESYWIAKKMRMLHEEGHSYLDMAVLYRSNYLSRSIEKTLVNMGIPYVVYGGLRFYDRAEIKDMMSYLRMITHGDDLALRRSIVTPRRKIGEKTLNKIADEAKENGRTMYEHMCYLEAIGEAKANIAGFVRLIEDLRAYYILYPSIDRLMQRILEDSGLRKMYEKDEEIERLESIKELMGDAISFQESNPSASLESYVQMVSLYGDKDSVLEGEFVRLMTVHAAKGLEFDTVFIMGLNDDVFPNRTSVIEGKEGIQEERRLAYVAVTRAKKRLFLSSNQGFSYVMGRGNRPSRFIKEMENPSLVHETKRAAPRQSTPQFETRQSELITRAKNNYRPGDLIVHDEFGEGIVISIDEDTVKIAFKFPFGTKTISRMFAGIRLKGVLT
ncbi:ATP-dependent DNA helicase PcrA [Erysipelothrix larvae]|uniref:DNA 3'-5' helicase n=1 Tax=Erysipelothrix larvae TaxID=1514105 RepID=A0A109UGH6_9FIRM|nr:UvrD-helicase domain-containing protein [Erysipelothrix larvae]AMC92642.1 ATP-dependent DNA helicase PcrA [Erysipelothrix larvae]